MNLDVDKALQSFCQKGMMINITDGKFMLFRPEGIRVMPMTINDLELVKKYISLINAGVKLKQYPLTEDEREYRKIYDHLRYKEKVLKTATCR